MRRGPRRRPCRRGPVSPPIPRPPPPRPTHSLPSLECVVYFVRSGATWPEASILRDGRNYSQFGAAVALRADGGRAAVGVPSDAPAATGAASGSVRVYELRDGAFREEFLLVPR